MATVASLIERIEKRINLAAGMNVQVHAEDQLLEMLRHKYNTLFDSHWWQDYLLMETFTLDGVTGQITGSVADKILRYIDIHSVFRGGDAQPLPMRATVTNPTLNTTTRIAPSSDKTKVFRVLPMDTAGEVHVWFRSRLSDEAWDITNAETTDVNMDDELLITGTVYDYLVDDASNEESARKYEQQYNARFDQLTLLGFQQGISKVSQSAGVATDWRIM